MWTEVPRWYPLAACSFWIVQSTLAGLEYSTVSSGALLPLTAFQSPRTSLTMRGQSLPVAWLPSSATSGDSTVTHPAPPAPTAGAEGEETKSGAGEGKGEGETTKPAVGKRVVALSVGGCACVVPFHSWSCCSPNQELAVPSCPV
jgi:hypothetical protein